MEPSGAMVGVYSREEVMTKFQSQFVSAGLGCFSLTVKSQLRLLNLNFASYLVICYQDCHLLLLGIQITILPPWLMLSHLPPSHLPLSALWSLSHLSSFPRSLSHPSSFPPFLFLPDLYPPQIPPVVRYLKLASDRSPFSVAAPLQSHHFLHLV